MEYRTAAWTFGGVLVVFKLWSFVLIAMFTDTPRIWGFLLASHALWIFVPVALIWGPALFWYRIIRVRSRRKQLQQQEWHVEESHLRK